MPYGIPVPGQKGMVTSPYSPEGNYIDVSGFAPGSAVKRSLHRKDFPGAVIYEHIMKEFEGKVALVTGGGSGIGRATALAFGREGAQVVIGNRNVQRGEETASMIRDAGGYGQLPADGCPGRSRDRSVGEPCDRQNMAGLDVAFNNAGIEGDV